MSLYSASNVTTGEFDAAAFEKLAVSRLSTIPLHLNEAHAPGDDDLNPGILRFSGELRHAAVLVPVVARTPLTTLLTERTGHLSAHAGQIAFPGGKVETHDSGPLAAALRETREEIALDAAFIQPLGYLPPYRTGTGYIITPCVALVRPGFRLVPNPEEVADIFEVPFGFLMDTGNHHVESRIWGGAERRFYAMTYDQRYIWGATAGIIRALSRRLTEA